MVCLIVCILISAALFSSLVLFVVVAVALFVFGGLHFDLVLGLTRAFLSLFVLSLRRDLNKNSSKPCSYLRHVLEKTRLKVTLYDRRAR